MLSVHVQMIDLSLPMLDGSPPSSSFLGGERCSGLATEARAYIRIAGIRGWEQASEGQLMGAALGLLPLCLKVCVWGGEKLGCSDGEWEIKRRGMYSSHNYLKFSVVNYTIHANAAFAQALSEAFVGLMHVQLLFQFSLEKITQREAEAPLLP